MNDKIQHIIVEEIRAAIDSLSHDKELLTVKEVCDRAKISRSTLNGMVLDGLRYYKFGGKKFLWSDVLSFLKRKQ